MQFFIDNIFLVAVVLVSAGALFIPMFQRRGARVSQLQATQLMNQNKTLVLDVRNPDEFATGYLPAAKLIPLAELASRFTEIEKSKSNPIIVYCKSGVRSASAVSVLKSQGFEQAFSLEGGIDAWREQGLPILKA